MLFDTVHPSVMISVFQSKRKKYCAVEKVFLVIMNSDWITIDPLVSQDVLCWKENNWAPV